jgi:hypothetical protein
MSATLRSLLPPLALFLFSFVCVPHIATAQESAGPGDQSGMGGMDMGSMHHGTNQPDPSEASANMAMSSEHMHMDPHMFMTALRPVNAADQKRADQLVATVRQAIEQYKDYRVAEQDGYKPFFPNFPQAIYHFTNWQRSLDSEFTFDPTRPPSLLYKKTADGWELVGAMFTARKRANLEDLNARVPLSVARWHKHVNLCLPPRGASVKAVNWKEYGLTGSISTEQACEDADGRWIPEIFGWMVHVYPFQTDPAKVWAH